MKKDNGTEELKKALDTALRSNQVIGTVVNQDYDYIMVVTTQTNRYQLFAASQESLLNAVPMTGDYAETVKRYAEEYVFPDDYRIAVDEMKLDYVMDRLKEQQVYESRARVVKPGEGIRYKQIKFSYLDEKKEQILITRVDITALIREEEKKREELTRALHLVEEATKAKNDFFARMSHDMRTPLNGILGSVSLAIASEEHSQQMAEYLHDIQFSGDFLLNLINDVLDMSKIESGVMELLPQEYTYFEFIRNMTKMIEPLCRSKRITLNMNPLNHDCIIRVDILRFQQIFFNIFSNAVKYTPEGGTIDHYTEITPIDENHIDCKCHIIDNGIGMSEEFQKHLFEPYTRERQHHPTITQGTGLGLSIANHLAHLMGGELTIKSELGKGTKVTVHTILETIKESEKEKMDHTGNVFENKEALRGRRILICEDHPLNAKITRQLLSKWGATSEHAENGELGVKMFRDSAVGYYDLILMDIRMPVMDGLQAAKLIRAASRADASTIPIIAMTANAYVSDREQSLNAGMNEHLAKPIEPKKLYETLLEYLPEK